MTPEQREGKRRYMAAWRQTPAGRESRRREDAMRAMAIRVTSAQIERVMRNVVKTPTHWLWVGVTNAGGYGVTGINCRSFLVHKLLWEQENGPVPDGRVCGHRCPDGVRPDCVNPAHIEAITVSENNFDKYGGRCARRLHCFADPGVTGINPDSGSRYCRPCRQASDRARYHQRRRSMPSPERVSQSGPHPLGAEYSARSVDRIARS